MTLPLALLAGWLAPRLVALALAIPLVLALAELGLAYGRDRWHESHRKGWSERDLAPLRARLVTKFEGVEVVGDAIPPERRQELQQQLQRERELELELELTQQSTGKR